MIQVYDILRNGQIYCFYVNLSQFWGVCIVFEMTKDLMISLASGRSQFFLGHKAAHLWRTCAAGRRHTDGKRMTESSRPSSPAEVERFAAT